jgi:hypothetical protein
MPLSTGTNIILRSGQDPDALAYFARAGIVSGTQTPTAYDNAASFNGTNQFLSRASNSTLQVGGTSFSISCWMNATEVTSYAGLVTKWIGGTTKEFALIKNANTVQMYIYTTGNNGIGSTTATINSIAWYHFVAVIDDTTKTFTLYTNGVAGSPVSYSGSITSGTAPFNIGVDSPSYFNGSIAGVGFWKRALSASEVTALFNSGAGRTYASLDSGLRNNLISWWALNGTSSAVSLTDSHGVVTGTPNNLTNNGSVTAPNIGPIITGYSDSRRLISDFVRGIKSLGLWNSMVCWPLRASQNAGGGTTAFSLGGLGQFNGSLVNAPTWGANGMVATTSNSYVQTSVPFNYATIGAYSGIGVGNIPSGINTRMIGTNAATTTSVATTSTNGAYATFDQFGSTPWIVTNSTNNQIAHWVNITKDASNSFVGYINNDSGFSSTATTLGNSSGLSLALFGSNGTSIGGVYPFFAWINTQVTSGQNAAAYSLYRQTLGLGLGLP